MTDYEVKRAQQASRPKTPLETIIASITKGTKTSPSKLDVPLHDNLGENYRDNRREADTE